MYEVLFLVPVGYLPTETYIRMIPYNDHRVPVTTTIARTQYDLIKKERWRLNDLISLGIAVKHDDDKTKEKITEYEYAQKNLMNIIKSLRSRIEAMEDRELGVQNAAAIK